MNASNRDLHLRVHQKGFREEKSYRVVIKDLDLSINSGSFVTLLAPSGSGKSTLLRIIAGLDSDYDGEVVIEGILRRAADRDCAGETCSRSEAGVVWRCGTARVYA